MFPFQQIYYLHEAIYCSTHFMELIHSFRLDEVSRYHHDEYAAYPCTGIALSKLYIYKHNM